MRTNLKISRKFVIPFVLIWIFLAFSINDLWPIGKPAGQIETLFHEDYNFSVDFPSEWIARRFNDIGYHGDKETKLLILESLSSRNFSIRILYSQKQNPTLDDAINWGNTRLNDLVNQLNNKGSQYKEISNYEDILNGTEVVRRVFEFDTYIVQHVYITRSNDMIIIQFISIEDEYTALLPRFEAVLQSFRPIN